MRIIIFTANAVRHRYVANQLSRKASDSLVISEVMAGDSNYRSQEILLRKHFDCRLRAEQRFFPGNDFFVSKTLPILGKEVNSTFVYRVVKEFRPDMMFVFGASIIKEPLLSMLSAGRFINLHLGLSPYYRGSGTNFWPFVNKELEYVGSTILYLDSGVDTGDIIAHVRPTIERADTVHTLGCKVIKESASCLCKIMEMVGKGKKLNRVRQWKVRRGRYYRNCDFAADALLRYKKNMRNGLVQDYLKGPRKRLKAVPLIT